MVDITVQDVRSNRDDYVLIDVREPHEVDGPLGHIEGSLLVTLGQDFLHFLETADLSKRYVFICLSGYRSSVACEIATTYGFQKVFNLKGGMIEWGKLISNCR